MPVYPAISSNGKQFIGPNADGTAGQVMETDGAGNLTFVDQAGGHEFVSGTYTGDGTTSQVITAGFSDTSKVVQYVRIWQRITVDENEAAVCETTTDIIDDIPSGAAFNVKDSKILANAIIALGADAFTVDDDGADLHPNQSGQIYNFVAIG